MKLFLTVIMVTMLTTPVAAQWLNHPTPGIPRTADGKPNLTAAAPRAHDGRPDLTGLWNTRGTVRKLDPGDVRPWAQALLERRGETFFKDNPVYLCLPNGPGYPTGGGMKRILQTPALVAILNEDLTYRQIFTDGRGLETDPNPTWMGYSVGRWEGETLVVESAGFNDRTWLDFRGLPHTDALRMTERYRRRDFGHLEVEVTFTDPAAYTRPWSVAVDMELAADTELLEAVCNEGPSRREHWVGKASDAQKSAVKVAPNVLTKYVGVYRGLYGRNIRTVEMTLTGEELFVGIGGGRMPLAAQSETLFVSVDGLAYEFIWDGQSMATHVVEHHVSGAYKYERQR
jgi:hypothetical protein